MVSRGGSFRRAPYRSAGHDAAGGWMARSGPGPSAGSAAARSRRVAVRVSSMPTAMKISASVTASEVMWCVPSHTWTLCERLAASANPIRAPTTTIHSKA